MGRIGEKVKFSSFLGLNTKIKSKINIFMSLNREVISFSFSVALIVFVY